MQNSGKGWEGNFSFMFFLSLNLQSSCVLCVLLFRFVLYYVAAIVCVLSIFEFVMSSNDVLNDVLNDEF
jgi:hypothetical protein